VFLLPFLVFIPLGIAQIATVRRTPFAVVVLLGFMLAPLAASIAVPEEPYASDRELALLIFGVLLAMFGIERLLANRQRWARSAAVALMTLVPLHFAFFLVHYFGDYHRRAAFWFEWDHLGALQEIIDRNPQRDRPVFLSNGDDAMMEAYWRLALARNHDEELIKRTVYFDARRISLDTVPPHALIVINRNDAALVALVASGQLHQLAAITEPGDDPYYFVVER
jgi:hypothetical protein